MNNKDWRQKLKSMFQAPEKGEGKPKLTKHHYLLLVFIIGVSFMLVSQILSPPSSKQEAAVPASKKTSSEEQAVFKPSSSGKANNSIEDVEQEYENQLKEILETIIGVEDVSIVVNVDATSLKVFEKNKSNKSTTTEETDKEGGVRSVTDQTKEEEVVIIKNGNEETPVVVQTKKPDIRGVLVVAQGVDNVQIKKTIIEAVTRVLDVPSHRVAVAPKKIKEDSE
ncbi:stage III sporulation protein AG [Bacillus altitudinis]|nr:stage III sporulation protein AG [Bacillus altitudinis]MCL6798198.1 stage III sporulation protein AG [Bacillus altitudinis]